MNEISTNFNKNPLTSYVINFTGFDIEAKKDQTFPHIKRSSSFTDLKSLYQKSLTFKFAKLTASTQTDKISISNFTQTEGIRRNGRSIYKLLNQEKFMQCKNVNSDLRLRKISKLFPISSKLISRKNSIIKRPYWNASFKIYSQKNLDIVKSKDLFNMWNFIKLLHQKQIMEKYFIKWTWNCLVLILNVGFSLKTTMTSLYTYLKINLEKSFHSKYHQETKDQIQSLKSDFELFKQKYEGEINRRFELIAEEFRTINEEIKKIQREIGATRVSVSDSRFPPPPPPLPAPPTVVQSAGVIKVTEKEKKSPANQRPLITLDDLLKVKLRKISVTKIDGNFSH